jgi:hypothetical protein
MTSTEQLAQEFAKRAYQARVREKRRTANAQSEMLRLRAGLYRRFAERLRDASRTWTKE